MLFASWQKKGILRDNCKVYSVRKDPSLMWDKERKSFIELKCKNCGRANKMQSLNFSCCCCCCSVSRYITYKPTNSVFQCSGHFPIIRQSWNLITSLQCLVILFYFFSHSLSHLIFIDFARKSKFNFIPHHIK
jgi:hypothetical protein